MDRVSRFLLFIGIFGLLYFGFSKLNGGGEKEVQPIHRPVLTTAPSDKPVESCDLWTPEYHATVSTRGAVLTHYRLLSAKYKKNGETIDLVTTPDHPELSPLFAELRSLKDPNPTNSSLLGSDVQNFSIEKADGKGCVLVYRDGSALVRKSFKTGGGLYGLDLDVEIQNLANESRAYTLSIGATTYRKNADVQSGMFRQNPAMTKV